MIGTLQRCRPSSVIRLRAFFLGTLFWGDSDLGPAYSENERQAQFYEQGAHMDGFTQSPLPTNTAPMGKIAPMLTVSATNGQKM